MKKQDNPQKDAHIAELEEGGLPTIARKIPMPKVKPPKDSKSQVKPTNTTED